MEKEKNFIEIVKLNLKVNIYIIIEEKVKLILMGDQNMKVIIYIQENGMEKDMMRMVI